MIFDEQPSLSLVSDAHAHIDWILTETSKPQSDQFFFMWLNSFALSAFCFNRLAMAQNVLWSPRSFSWIIALTKLRDAFLSRYIVFHVLFSCIQLFEQKKTMFWPLLQEIPFPNDETLQKSLQDKVNWDAYRRKTLKTLVRQLPKNQRRIQDTMAHRRAKGDMSLGEDLKEAIKKMQRKDDDSCWSHLNKPSR